MYFILIEIYGYLTHVGFSGPFILKSEYFDHFPVCLEGAPDLLVSFFNWSSPRTEMLYLGPPHEQKCFTWDSPTNRNALPGTPPRTEMLYLGHPHEQKCFTWDSPRTELDPRHLPTNSIRLQTPPHEQN